MRTQVRRVVSAAQLPLEYAIPKAQSTESRQRPEAGREKEKIKEMLIPLVKAAVQRELREQQDYYKSRPSLAARQMEQIFGAGSVERALAPMISLQVYGQLEDRIRHEWIRKGR